MGLGCAWGSCLQLGGILTAKLVDDSSYRVKCYSRRGQRITEWNGRVVYKGEVCCLGIE